MRWLRVAAPAIGCAAWLALASAQQTPPPAGTPPPARTPPAGTPPAGTPPPSRPPADGAPPEKETDAKPPTKEDNDVFVPTEELQPDAAVTFPVDI
jgi:hypothetical protein